MTMTLFAFPIKPGKFDDYKKFIRECVGPRKAEYKDLLMRYGLNSVKLWHQQFDGKDYVLFIHDMDDDAMERLKQWPSSTHPFDIWFNQHLIDCYDAASVTNLLDQPELVCELDARR